jgi:hypothetical protein
MMYKYICLPLHSNDEDYSLCYIDITYHNYILYHV